MKAMVLKRLGSLDHFPNPLSLKEIPRPVPRDDEILIRISTCGVCHTEIDEIEGRTPPKFLPIVPGHQAIGEVVESGESVTRFCVGDRVGVGWIHSSSGAADENISDEFCATGRDVNGGYAEFLTVQEDYAYEVPAVWSDVEAAPLLCAGAIGFRALKLAEIHDGETLGLTGFGGSAHLVLQLARATYPSSEIHVFARSDSQRKYALECGASWAGDTEETPPSRSRAIIDTTPAWKPVIAALACLCPGGRLIINAIRKDDADKSELLNLSYHEHLWMEREIKTVANITQFDIREFLVEASRIPIRPCVQTYPLTEANTAIQELHAGRFVGSKVLVIR